MSVTVLISGLMYGGGQKVVEDLRQTLAQSAPDLLLMGMSVPCKGMSPNAVLPFDGRYNKLPSLWRTVRALIKWLRQHGDPTVHSHGWDADLVAWLASWRRPIHRLVHLHVTPGFLYSKRWRDRLRRIVARRMLGGARVVAVSDAVRAHWCNGLSLPVSQVAVVHNGVDLGRFNGADRDDPTMPMTLGVAARLAPMKGLEFLIDALTTLRGEGAPLRLMIAGEGSLRPALEARVKERGLSADVRFLGHVEDMPSFYRQIDLFVLPSVAMEGFPLGILEAMASALPVVATRVGGAPESVENGVTGILVQARDASALAGAIRSFVEAPESLRCMGKAGRDRAEREFSLDSFGRAMEAVYRGLGGPA